MSGSGIWDNRAPQREHLVKPGMGFSAELFDFRQDVGNSLKYMAALTVEEFTNPPAASANAIKTSVASSTSAQSYSGAALNGAVGGATMAIPRNITATTAGGTPADVPATATITGKDVDGNTITETLTLSQTAATVAGVKMFASVTQIDMPAGQGTAGTLTFGTGLLLGLRITPKSRAGGVVAVREVVDGALVTTGTLSSAATNAPHGAYTPATAPDGSHDYAVYYEYDVTTVPL